MSKRLKTTILSFLVLCSSLYINYNIPVFQQLFSFFFYSEIEATKTYPTGFECISVNVVKGFTFLDRNEYILLGGTVDVRVYNYTVDGRDYRVQKRTYTGSPFSCEEPDVKHIYYFPLHPEWSVTYNSFPESPYLLRFVISTFILACVIAMYRYAVRKQSRGSNH